MKKQSNIKRGSNKRKFFCAQFSDGTFLQKDSKGKIVMPSPREFQHASIWKLNPDSIFYDGTEESIKKFLSIPTDCKLIYVTPLWELPS